MSNEGLIAREDVISLEDEVCSNELQSLAEERIRSLEQQVFDYEELLERHYEAEQCKASNPPYILSHKESKELIFKKAFNSAFTEVGNEKAELAEEVETLKMKCELLQRQHEMQEEKWKKELKSLRDKLRRKENREFHRFLKTCIGMCQIAVTTLILGFVIHGYVSDCCPVKHQQLDEHVRLF